MNNRNANTLESITTHEFVGGVDGHSSRANINDLLAGLEDTTSKVERGLALMGLTNNEAKVYLLLAKKGASKASEVSKGLDLPRTETYTLLGLLQKKGLVRCTMHYPLRFVAVPFDNALNVLLGIERQKMLSFETQGKMLLQLWNSIANSEVIQEETEEEKFQILEGSNAVYRRIRDMVSAAEKDVIIMADQKELARLYHNQVTDNFSSNAKGVSARVLTSKQTDPEILTEMKHAEVRVLTQPVADMHFIVVDGRQMLFFIKNSSLGDTPCVMWTDCESLVQCIFYLFKELWNNSETR